VGPPIEKLTEFKGNILLGDERKQELEEDSKEEDKLSLNNKQLLLRGVRICNTKRVYGVGSMLGSKPNLP